MSKRKNKPAPPNLPRALGGHYTPPFKLVVESSMSGRDHYVKDANGLVVTYQDIERLLNTLTAQLAAAQAQVAERDRVLGALGFEGERYELAAWAAGKGMRYNAYEGFWCSQAPHAVFNCHHEKDGNWWLAHCGWRHFSAGEHEAAWAAFNAARGGKDE